MKRRSTESFLPFHWRHELLDFFLMAMDGYGATVFVGC